MHDEVDLAPALLYRLEERVDAGLVRHVAFDNEVRAQLRGKRIDPFFERLTLIGKRQFRPGPGQCLGDAPGNGLVIGEPHDQPTFSCHQPHATLPFSKLLNAGLV